jgi:hypothetical protein
MSSIVLFVTPDSQFSRMITESVDSDGRVLILAFNQLGECLSFVQENPKMILVHLNHCNEFTKENQKIVDDLITFAPDLKFHFVIPSENEYYPIENYISLENVIFKSGDVFKEIKELIFSSL